MDRFISDTFMLNGKNIPEVIDLCNPEAPEPMETILLAGAGLGSGDTYLARLPHVPYPLFPHLETRGLTWQLHEEHAPTTHETVQGMRMAVASLAVITIIGLVMASGFAGGVFSANRMLWVQVHLTLAFLGWVGGLIMAVSWQVIPMFYLTPNFGKTTKRRLLVLLLAGLVLPLLVAITGVGFDGFLSPSRLAAIAALPAAIAIWLLYPALALRNISKRQRKRGDASLFFWQAGLVSGQLIIPIAIAALVLPDPRWQVLLGWLLIWGWAATIMHGMLTRIVPFLVWFHRYSARVGLEVVPSCVAFYPKRGSKPELCCI